MIGVDGRPIPRQAESLGLQRGKEKTRFRQRFFVWLVTRSPISTAAQRHSRSHLCPCSAATASMDINAVTALACHGVTVIEDAGQALSYKQWKEQQQIPALTKKERKQERKRRMGMGYRPPSKKGDYASMFVHQIQANGYCTATIVVD